MVFSRKLTCVFLSRNLIQVFRMVVDLTKKIHIALKKESNSERKEKIASYLKTSSLNFIGVELPVIHQIVKTFTKGLDTSKMPALMGELWKIDTFETRLAAIDVMKVYAKKGSVENSK